MDIIFIDLDDTMCDFKKAHRLAIEKEPGIIYPQSQFKFFENLEPIEGAIESYFKLKEKYHVFMLSKPSVYNKLSLTEKMVWVEKHLGFKECDKLILSCDKTLSRGRYLIDDCIQKGLLIPDWEFIQFRSSKFPDWKTIIKYLI
jgi:5'(3')-deoxyribonucleotidase